MSFIYDLERSLIWYVDRELHQEMFYCGIHTGSLAYHKRLWNTTATFPAIDLAEDVAFIRTVVGRGAQLLRLPNDVLFASLSPVEAAGALPFLEDIVRRSGDALFPPRRPTCLYVRHATNTWRFVCGEHLNPAAWHKLAPDDLLPGPDLAYYRRLATAGRSQPVATIARIEVTQADQPRQTPARWPLDPPARGPGPALTELKLARSPDQGR
jgi:hypothetical protein